jgi:hypothetical protein
MQVICPHCGMRGSLQKKQTISKGKQYLYYRVMHLSYETNILGPNGKLMLNGNGKPYKREKRNYCTVPTDWALQIIEEEKLREAEAIRKILGK